MIVALINTAIGHEPPGGAQIVTDLLVAIIASIFVLALGAAVCFLFFGFLAYKENFQDMPHKEAHNDH